MREGALKGQTVHDGNNNWEQHVQDYNDSSNYLRKEDIEQKILENDCPPQHDTCIPAITQLPRADLEIGKVLAPTLHYGHYDDKGTFRAWNINAPDFGQGRCLARQNHRDHCWRCNNYLPVFWSKNKQPAAAKGPKMCYCCLYMTSAEFRRERCMCTSCCVLVYNSIIQRLAYGPGHLADDALCLSFSGSPWDDIVDAQRQVLALRNAMEEEGRQPATLASSGARNRHKSVPAKAPEPRDHRIVQGAWAQRAIQQASDSTEMEAPREAPSAAKTPPVKAPPAVKAAPAGAPAGSADSSSSGAASSSVIAVAAAQSPPKASSRGDAASRQGRSGTPRPSLIRSSSARTPASGAASRAPSVASQQLENLLNDDARDATDSAGAPSGVTAHQLNRLVSKLENMTSEWEDFRMKDIDTLAKTFASYIQPIQEDLHRSSGHLADLEKSVKTMSQKFVQLVEIVSGFEERLQAVERLLENAPWGDAEGEWQGDEEAAEEDEQDGEE